jgi:hypothetical protein
MPHNSYLQLAVFWLGRQRTELALYLRFAGGNLHRKTIFFLKRSTGGLLAILFHTHHSN